MSKMVISVVVVVICLLAATGSVSWLTYFWINKNRQWRHEEEDRRSEKFKESVRDLQDVINSSPIPTSSVEEDRTSVKFLERE